MFENYTDFVPGGIGRLEDRGKKFNLVPSKMHLESHTWSQKIPETLHCYER